MVLVIPDDWNMAIDEIVLQSLRGFKVVVLGNKGTGKSSFVKLLSDRFVNFKGCTNSTVILDADSGQPDKSPPGTVCLYLKERIEGVQSIRIRIVSQRFLGYVNPATDPFAYTAMVAKIYEDYCTNQEEYSELPFIVNCHGWGTGCGRDTWNAVISIVKPDLVIYLGEGEFSVSNGNQLVDGLSIPEESGTEFALKKLDRVIVIDDENQFSMMDSSDKRWIKIASHFRPELVDFFAMEPNDFFKFPFVRTLVLPIDQIGVEYVGIDIAPDEYPVNLIEKTIVGVVHTDSGQCTSLAWVQSVSESEVKLFVPWTAPQLDQKVTLMRSRELNWSPRDSVCFKGKRTLVNFSNKTNEPHFLPNVLGGVGGKVVSGRTNLKRKGSRNS